MAQESSLSGRFSGGWWTLDYDEWKKRLEGRWQLEKSTEKSEDPI